MRIKPKKENALEMDINDLFTTLQEGKDVHVPRDKKGKVQAPKTKAELTKLVTTTDLEQSVEHTRELIAGWSQHQIPDALVMTIEFCHCNNCHHEWRQMRYGSLMVRMRNKRASLYTYKPIEVMDSVPPDLQKLVQIEAKETPHCMSCFIQEALVENLAEGYRSRVIVQGDRNQFDLFEVQEKGNEDETEKGSSISYPARERQGALNF